MSEVIVQFTEPIVSEAGVRYVGRVVGERQEQGTWFGWIEFLQLGGGVAITTDRETTQSDRDDLEYWASGLSSEYLEGALKRALSRHFGPRPEKPAVIPPPQAQSPITSRSAAPSRRSGAVIDPFAVYEQGEGVLIRELGALDGDHLRNIVRAFDLNDGRMLATATDGELVTLIVSGVRARMENGSPSARGVPPTDRSVGAG